MTDEYSVINVMKIRAGKNVGQINYPFEDAVGNESINVFIRLLKKLAEKRLGKRS